ncbi:MAG: Hpt domain-containing protein [Candidatus Hydrogenedentes bacterium]|nr:Hpt domain-containing protein [Candidatus Hydrogenedentota bacterium]
MPSEGQFDSPPLDFARIREASGGDGEFERDLFEAYVEDCGGRVAGLRGLHAAGDADQLRREAHTIKGASANIGTARLHEIAGALETADSAMADGLIAEAEDEFTRVRSAIHAYLSSE